WPDMEIPSEGTVGNSNGRLRAISGRQPRGKVTILRKSSARRRGHIFPHSSDGATTRLGRYPGRFKHSKTFHSAPHCRCARYQGDILETSPRPSGQVFPECSPGGPTAARYTSTDCYPPLSCVDMHDQSDGNRFVPTKGPATCSNQMSGRAF